MSSGDANAQSILTRRVRAACVPHERAHTCSHNCALLIFIQPQTGVRAPIHETKNYNASCTTRQRRGKPHFNAGAAHKIPHHQCTPRSNTHTHTTKTTTTTTTTRIYLNCVYARMRLLWPVCRHHPLPSMSAILCAVLGAEPRARVHLI